METNPHQGGRGGKSNYIAPAVQRAVALLRHIAGGDPVTNMNQTAKALKINRTTLLRLLHTLEMEGFIERRPGGAGYQIGLQLLSFAANVFFSQDIVQVALPICAKLAEVTRLSAHFGILEGTDILYLVRKTPDVPLASTIRVGSRLPAHATTMGRAILAYMEREEVDRLFAGQDLPRYTDHTPTSLKDLHKRLEEDRREGLAWSDAYFEETISSVAAPVFDFGTAPVGALNVSGPVGIFNDPNRRQEIGAAVRSAARELSQRLGWVDTAVGKPVLQLRGKQPNGEVVKS